MQLASASDGVRELLVRNMFTGYKRTQIKPNELIVAIRVPAARPLEWFHEYKQCRRRDDDIAIANGGMRVVLDGTTGLVSEASLAFGGMVGAGPLLPIG